MRKKYVFKTFATRGGKYVYDRSVGTFFRVSDEEYLVFQQIERGQLDADTSAVFCKYQQVGFLQENCVEKIEHPQLELLPYLAEHHLNYMILQVTQQCNFRCEYCIYSGAYEHQRQHSQRRMTFETAKKAIDFYLAHSDDAKLAMFGFYGGEPLLEYDLIKKCVLYIESQVEGKPIRFSITTNATLLDDERIDFLVEHEFSILISLDGNKEEHDRSRKFISGEGTFDTVIRNVKRIRERHPTYMKNIQFNAVMNPQGNLACVLEFFAVDEVLADSMVMFNDINTKDLKMPMDQEENFWLLRRYEHLKCCLNYIGKLDKKYTSPMARRAFLNVKLSYKQMLKHAKLSPCAHHGGPCIPGVMRLFVTVDGRLFPCQVVSETSDYYCIGTLDSGLDMQRMGRLLNNGEITASECMDCWKLALCNICSANISFEGESYTKAEKMLMCKQQDQEVLGNLRDIAVLSEFGCDLENVEV
nr:Cys-rich peptide radical SAM maturase CcpM [Maliibacterium massiliense]